MNLWKVVKNSLKRDLFGTYYKDGSESTGDKIMKDNRGEDEV